MLKKAYEVRKEHCEELRATKSSGASNYVVLANNGRVFVHQAAACHSALNIATGFPYIITYVTKLDEEFVGRHNMLMYYDWLLNRSPWAKTFRTKSARVAIDKGIISDGNYPANLVMGGIIAVRFAWEYREKLISWSKLVNNGVNENFAFYLSHSFTRDSIVRGSSGHYAIQPIRMTEEDMCRFIKGKPYKKALRENKMKDKGAYCYVSALFSKNDVGAKIGKEWLPRKNCKVVGCYRSTYLKTKGIDAYIADNLEELRSFK